MSQTHLIQPPKKAFGLGRAAPAIVSLLILSAACSSKSEDSHPWSSSVNSISSAKRHPELVAAAQQRLTARSNGFQAGDPTTASSLSSGNAAAADQAQALANKGLKDAGDTTLYGFDTLSVYAYPLDGGDTDFIAYEKLRNHSDASVYNRVELYHRENASAAWKATAQARFADNIDLPPLKLDDKGNAHLLTAEEMTSQNAQPSEIAGKYAAAMTSGATTGKLPDNTFVPGQYTTGQVNDAAVYLAQVKGTGAGEVEWDARGGQQGVALASGVLTFSFLERVRTFRSTGEIFAVQDPQRRSFGGLLAAGNYLQISETYLITIASAVPKDGLPDVVGLETVATAVTGQLFQR